MLRSENIQTDTFTTSAGPGSWPQAYGTCQKAQSGRRQDHSLHVIDQVTSFANYYLSSENEEKIHESAKKAIEERIGAEKDAEAVVLSGHPGRTITDYAEKIGADCIIAGSHKPEMKDFLLGSTAARIVRHAPCSVHVIR